MVAPSLKAKRSLLDCIINGYSERPTKQSVSIVRCNCSLYPERAKYPWVGCTSGGGGGAGEDGRVAHGSELFMAADAKMITIGGG